MRSSGTVLDLDDSSRTKNRGLDLDALAYIPATHLWELVVLVVWRSGSALVSINEVNRRRARLVLGWVTVSGFDSRRRHFISVCNQPPRSTQPSTLHGTVK